MGDRQINDAWATWLQRRMRAVGHDTPTKLGNASGVDQSVISRWLNEGRTPKVDQLRKIAEPLQVGMIELLVAAGYVSSDEVGSGAADIAVRTIGVADAIRDDDGLIDEAREHLLNQYDLLRRLSDAAGSKDTRRPATPAQRPLRAVARKRPQRKP